jgi:hypothetical protein
MKARKNLIHAVEGTLVAIVVAALAIAWVVSKM